MIVWIRRLFRSDESESGQTEEAKDAISTARRVQCEIDERIALRGKEVSVIRIEQARVRRELSMSAKRNTIEKAFLGKNRGPE